MHMLHMIKRMTYPIALAAVFVTMLTPVHGAQPQPQQPQAQTEFVPVDDLPQQEQIPAAPLLIAAYAVSWVGLFIYLASIWRRLQRVDHDLADVARRITERSRT